MAANSPKVKTPDIVLIEWRDAEHDFGWMDGNDIDDTEPVLNCFTVGWVLKETKKHIRVCQTMTTDNHAQVLVIPRGMVISKKILQRATKRCLGES